jgi:hypothetical protein
VSNKTRQIPQWGTVPECDEAEHDIDTIYNDIEDTTEWICTKCGYIEWFVKTPKEAQNETR